MMESYAPSGVKGLDIGIGKEGQNHRESTETRWTMLYITLGRYWIHWNKEQELNHEKMDSGNG